MTYVPSNAPRSITFENVPDARSSAERAAYIAGMLEAAEICEKCKVYWLK